MIEGQHAECGGAILSKVADAPWPDGSFQEEFALWQRDWFNITAPRGTKWVAPPTFRSGPPPRRASWVNEGLIWGPSKDVPLLQDHIRDLLERDINLTVVAQVMLILRRCPTNVTLFACGNLIRRDRESSNILWARRPWRCTNCSSDHKQGDRTCPRTQV